MNSSSPIIDPLDQQLRHRHTGEVLHGGRTLRQVLDDHGKWRLGEGGEQAVFRDAAFPAGNYLGIFFLACEFPGCEFPNCKFHDCKFRVCEFSDCEFRYCEFSGCEFSNCEFPNCKFRGCEFSNCEFPNCKFRGCEFSNCELCGCRFRGCEFSDCELRGIFFLACEFRGCEYRGCRFQRCEYRNCEFRDCTFHDCAFRGCEFRGCEYRGCVFRVCTFPDLDIPVIQRIHQRIYEAASQPNALDMSSIHHPCGTKHCRGGWAVHLAGEAGYALERQVDWSLAAALIYLHSDPALDRIPDFYVSNRESLADMRRLAELEAQREQEESC